MHQRFSNVAPDAFPSRPRWLRLAPFLVCAPALTPRQWQVLGLIAAASLFDRYDLALFSLALKQIQTGLGIAEGDLGTLGASVRLGALGAVLPMLAADRLGRRRLLLSTILGYTLLTGATAFAPDARVFVALQCASRAFITAELLLATVVIAEEFAPAVRGWGVGAANALAAGGYGLAWLLFAFVEVLPFGWRALYLIGLVPLGLIAFMRRGLPETALFAEHQEQRPQTRALSAPLAPLVASTPPLFIAAFYHAPSLLLGPLWVAMMFTLLGANVSIATYGAELFPTSYRATATGIRSIMATLGGVCGLAMEGIVYTALGSHWHAISLLALALCLTPLIVALAFPETSGRALEEIAPER